MPKIQQRTVSIPIATNKILTSSGFQELYKIKTDLRVITISAASNYDAIFILKKTYPNDCIERITKTFI